MNGISNHGEEIWIFSAFLNPHLYVSAIANEESSEEIILILLKVPSLPYVSEKKTYMH